MADMEETQTFNLELTEDQLQVEADALNSINEQIQDLGREREQRIGRITLLQEQISRAKKPADAKNNGRPPE